MSKKLSEEEIEYIEHDAIVSRVIADRNLVEVKITDADECGGCPAAALCGGNAHGENRVEISTSDAARYKPGDKVVIRGTERLHRQAIMLATVIPCVLLMAVMIIVFLITLNQLAACLAGLGTMVAFFLLLWFLRHKIRHEFTFTIVIS